MQKKPMSKPIRWQDFVEERPGVMMGKPVFKGTRLTVEHILEELGTGMLQSKFSRLTQRSRRTTFAPRCLTLPPW